MELLAYRDKKVVGVFVRFRRFAMQMTCWGDHPIYMIGQSTDAMCVTLQVLMSVEFTTVLQVTIGTADGSLQTSAYTEIGWLRLFLDSNGCGVLQ
jgi:hypothetical protein